MKELYSLGRREMKHKNPKSSGRELFLSQAQLAPASMTQALLPLRPCVMKTGKSGLGCIQNKLIFLLDDDSFLNFYLSSNVTGHGLATC